MEPAFNLTIGALSAEAGVAIETIRYYERIGLMPKPPRSAGGHRLYSNEHRTRLVFIRHCRELGFSLKDVRDLLGLAGRQHVACRVKTITVNHIAQIRSKVKDLERLERVLRSMATQCRGDESTVCAVLDALADQNKDICDKEDIIGRAR